MDIVKSKLMLVTLASVKLMCMLCTWHELKPTQNTGWPGGCFGSIKKKSSVSVCSSFVSNQQRLFKLTDT